MLLLVGFAVLVWYGVLRTRRSWAGLGILAGTLAALALVGWMHYRLNVWTGGAVYFPVLQGLLYPYIAMVIGVGTYLWAMPRSRPPGAPCPECDYDLTGLGFGVIRCPECGSNVGPRCRRCGRDHGSLGREIKVCPGCGALRDSACESCGLDLSGRLPASLRCPRCRARWTGAGALEERRTEPAPHRVRLGRAIAGGAPGSGAGSGAAPGDGPAAPPAGSAPAGP